MYNCKKCNLEIKNKGALNRHEKYCKLDEKDVEDIKKYYIDDLLSIRDLVDKYRGRAGKSIIHKILKGITRNLSDANKNARKKKPEKFKHSEKTKEKLRKIRLEWMKNNPDKTAWRNANLSYPEKMFKNKLEELGIDKKYLIVREYSVYPYYIDFAFVDEKIAIEIDGSQHELPERKKKDEEKDKLLNEKGWFVIRIPATNVLRDIDNLFSDLLKVLSNTKYDNTGIMEYPKYKMEFIKYYCECGNEMDRQSKNCKECSDIKQRKVNRPEYEVLLEEIENLGYCGTGRKYGVSDNAIRAWKKYYEKQAGIV